MWCYLIISICVCFNFCWFSTSRHETELPLMSEVPLIFFFLYFSKRAILDWRSHTCLMWNSFWHSKDCWTVVKSLNVIAFEINVAAFSWHSIAKSRLPAHDGIMITSNNKIWIIYCILFKHVFITLSSQSFSFSSFEMGLKPRIPLYYIRLYNYVCYLLAFTWFKLESSIPNFPCSLLQWLTIATCTHKISFIIF